MNERVGSDQFVDVLLRSRFILCIVRLHVDAELRHGQKRTTDTI